jgi:anti-sigma regulatory factor (Ser/Thr protein kinase)
MTQTIPDDETDRQFRHEALLYRGIDEFVSGVTAFVRDAVTAREPILVVVRAEKVTALQAALAPDDRAGVEFADMAAVGHNPARIIAAWQQFVADHASSAANVRGVGEPIDEHRHPLTIDECERHEALLNVAFDPPPALWLLCPYDVAALAAPLVDIAFRTHPFVTERGVPETSSAYNLCAARAPFATPLPPVRARTRDLVFDRQSVTAVRQFVIEHALAAGLDRTRIIDTALAVHELAVNCVTHGGDDGRLRIWNEQGYFRCEVTGGGTILDPLIGRETPAAGALNGRGLWLANQLCDLVQISSSREGTVVRVSMAGSTEP